VKLDAGKSPTIAHPAAPLAACDRNQQKLVVMTTSLEGSKAHFRLIMYSHSSTNPKNLAKSDPVDFEIIMV